MNWRSAIVLAAKGLRRRPGRAVLTVLAVMLAAALLTALLTISSTAETRVLDEMAKGGPLAGIKVSPAAPDPQGVGEDEASPGEPRDLDDAAVARIKDLPNVGEVVPVLVTREIVVSPTPGRDGTPPEPFLETVVGIDINLTASLPISVLNGRLPAPGALDEAVVSERYLERLGLPKDQGERVLGTVLELGAPQAVTGGQPGERLRIRSRWTKAAIVGVVAQEAAEGGILQPVEAVRTARVWSLSEGSGRFGIAPSPYAGLYVVADNLDDVGQARQEITAVGYATSAPENLIASVKRYLKVVEIVLAAVGAIALTVAALGISNAMLAAVRERRREIGVIKAIGGRDRDVRRMFLVEAGILGFTGGALGAAAGYLVARAVGGIVNAYLTEQGLRSVELELPVLTMLATLAGATVLSVVAGTLPAIGAARLPAREAVGAV